MLKSSLQQALVNNGTEKYLLLRFPLQSVNQSWVNTVNILLRDHNSMKLKFPNSLNFYSNLYFQI